MSTNNSTQTLADRIKHLRPCADAVEWLGQQRTPLQAWFDCERGDWLLWLIGSQVAGETWSDDRKRLLACCLDCAETVKHLWTDDRITKAVGTLRQWIDGKATANEANAARRELSAAADAATAAADASYAAADAATDAADAAYAASAAYAAYAAARAAADASYAAASYASYAAYGASQTATWRRLADIVRKHYPTPPKIKNP